MKTIKNLVTLIICIVSLNSFAQEINIEHDVASGGNLGLLNNVGQSFTPTISGKLTKIKLRSYIPNHNTTITIYNGALTTDGVLHTQSVNFINSTDLTTFVLDTPVPVVSGNVYSFRLGSANLWRHNTWHS